MKSIIILLVFIQSFCSYSQDCSKINTRIDDNISYVNKIEDLEMPLNKDWDIVIENQKAVLVFMKNKTEQASIGIVKKQEWLFH